MQTTARKNDWPLDKTVLITEVTKKLPEQLDGPSKDVEQHLFGELEDRRTSVLGREGFLS